MKPKPKPLDPFFSFKNEFISSKLVSVKIGDNSFQDLLKNDTKGNVPIPLLRKEKHYMHLNKVKKLNTI